MGSFMIFMFGGDCTLVGRLMSSDMFVFVVMAAAVLSNILAIFFKSFSVASPNSKCGVLGFVCSIKAVVKSFALGKFG